MTVQSYAVPLLIFSAILLIYIMHVSTLNYFYGAWGFRFNTTGKIKKIDNRTEVREQGENCSVTFIQDEDEILLEEALAFNRLNEYFRSKKKEATDGMLDGLYPIIQNYVHFVRLHEPEFTFTHALSVLSAYRNHLPAKIYIHTYNSSLSGPFWEKIQNTKGLHLILKVVPLNISKYIHGVDRHMSSNFVYNYLKLKILEEYGGIMLNGDMFVINNLDTYLRFEMILHSNRAGRNISDKIIFAKQNSRTLNKWIRGYSNQCLHANEATEPFQYIRYLLGRKTRLVFVENLRFAISYYLKKDIYNTVGYPWQEKHAVWLMEDLVEPEIRNRVASYAANIQIEKRMKTPSDDRLNNVSNSEKNSDCVFLQLVKDVYY